MRVFGLAFVIVAACGVSSPVSRELGARCDDKDECDERCLVGERYPGGLCSLSCIRDDDCPDGSACIEVEGGVCLPGCGIEECDYLGEGWSCQPALATSGDEVMVCLGS